MEAHTQNRKAAPLRVRLVSMEWHKAEEPIPGVGPWLSLSTLILDASSVIQDSTHCFISFSVKLSTQAERPINCQTASRMMVEQTKRTSKGFGNYQGRNHPLLCNLRKLHCS